MVPKIICGGGSAKTYQNNLEPDLVLSFQTSLRWYYFQKILSQEKTLNNVPFPLGTMIMTYRGRIS
jgi:hypothetical protein